MDHRRHQAQDPARALEFHQGGPVGIEPVEDFRMDRVRRTKALLVVGVAALGGELLLLRAVQIRKRPRHHVTVLEQCWIGQGLEEPPAHDLEPLLRACGPPRGFDPRHYIAQPLQRLAPALAAHFHIVRTGMG